MQNSGIFNSVSGKVRSSGPSVFSAAGPRRVHGVPAGDTPPGPRPEGQRRVLRQWRRLRRAEEFAREAGPSGGKSGMNRRRRRPLPRGYVRGEGII